MERTEWAVLWESDEDDVGTAEIEIEQVPTESAAWALAHAYPQWNPAVIKRTVVVGDWEEVL